MRAQKRTEESSFLGALMSIPVFYGHCISKDGKNVAFAWKNVHPNLDVFVIPTDGTSRPTALTETPEATFVVSFTPDSSSVIVGEDKGRNERVRLFLVELAKAKQMKPLTEENPHYFLRGGSLHPNKKWLIYAANYDVEKKQEIETTWVYKHDLETGEREPLAKPRKPAWVYPTLNSRGTHILYNRKDIHPKGDQLWLVDLDGEENREILNFGPKAKIQAEWLPDGRSIAYITETKDGKTQKHYSLGIYDLQNEESRWLISDPNRNIESLTSPECGHHLIILEYSKATLQSSIINLNTMEEDPLPQIKGSLIPIGPVMHQRWVGIHYSSTQPEDIVKFSVEDLREENLQSLTHVWERTSIKPGDLAKAQDFWWNARDGLNIHGWLYQPKTPSEKAIIYIHGGPTYHIEDTVIPQIQYYVSRGFNVLAPNYRGSTGYGVEFEDAIRVNGWGSDEQLDIQTGVEALIARGLGVKGKIGVTGTSYGGYSSWYAITKNPQLYAAAAPICGMTDLVVDYETTRPDLRPYSEEMLGGSPEEVPKRYHERSPINYVHQIVGSLLIIHGARDPNVTPKNTEVVRKKLDENAIKYDTLLFEDEGHGILKTKNQKYLYKKIADFFTEALT